MSDSIPLPMRRKEINSHFSQPKVSFIKVKWVRDLKSNEINILQFKPKTGQQNMKMMTASLKKIDSAMDVKDHT